MKTKLVVTLLGIGIGLMVSTDALATLRCTRGTCPAPLIRVYIGSSCFCYDTTGSLLEQVVDQVGNETKYPTAVEGIAAPLPVCWDDYTLYGGTNPVSKDNCDDINYWQGEDCGTIPESYCPNESSKTEYKMIISCGAPGNKNPAYGQNKVPYLGEWESFNPVDKQDIDRNGIARLLLHLEPPQNLIDWIIEQKICSNPNWHIDVLPLRISGTTIDIVAIKGPEGYTCYERSVAVDYFQLRNPDKVFPDRNLGWLECETWEGEQYTGDNCTATIPAAYGGAGLEFYDWTRELTEHPYGVCPGPLCGVCPDGILN